MRFDDRLAAWLIVATLTAALTATTTVQALHRYHDLRSGWSWDLAYYNQWFWSITRGDAVLSVRPISSYGMEGPSAWKSNYLSPARYLILSTYAAIPDPRTLLVVQNFVSLQRNSGGLNRDDRAIPLCSWRRWSRTPWTRNLCKRCSVRI